MRDLYDEMFGTRSRWDAELPDEDFDIEIDDEDEIASEEDELSLDEWLEEHSID